MKTFPKPLTAREERECLERYQEGDQEARATLIERNMRLVAHVAKKYQNTDYDMEDLLSVGTIGLIKAVNTFHPDRGSRLATYAAKCVENDILSQRLPSGVGEMTQVADPVFAGTYSHGFTENFCKIVAVCKSAFLGDDINI